MKNKVCKSIASVFMAMCMVITMSSTSLFMVVADALETKQESSIKSVEDDSTSKQILKNVQFSADKKGEIEFKITPKFDPNTKEYDIHIPRKTSRNEIYIKATANNNDDKIFVGTGEEEDSVEPTESITSDKYEKVYHNNINKCIQIKVGETIYKFNIKTVQTLSSLSINDTLSPAFDEDITKYDVYVPAEGAVSISTYGFMSDITYNGSTSNSITPEWDSNGEMEVKIELKSKNINEDNMYIITLHRQPTEDKPFFTIQPKDNVYLDGENSTATNLKIKASANGTLSYQWYENTTNSIEGGSAISGATKATYRPTLPSDIGEVKEKHIYYYCIVTNTKEDGSTFSESSKVADITVIHAPKLKLVKEDGEELPSKGYEVKVGDSLKVKVIDERNIKDGTFGSYVWKRDSATLDTTDLPSYELKFDKDGKVSYRCSVEYTIEDKTFNISTNYVSITQIADKAAKPEIKIQPEAGVYFVGETPNTLKTYATSSDGGNVSYQWQRSSNGKTYFYDENGATSQNFTPPTSSSVKNIYYRCRITNNLKSITGDEYSRTIYSEVVKIEFKSLDYYTQQLDANCFEGEGTAKNPYKIKNLSDLELLRDLVNKKGISFSSSYFKLENDITLSENWVSIGTLKEGTTDTNRGENIIPFSGILDGNNHTVTAAKGGLPLFKYVRHAVIKNLNIAGEYIAEDGLISDYVVDYGPGGSYGSDKGDTVEIDNVTIKSGTTIKGSGFLGGYASGINKVIISNCRVESNVKIGWNAEKNASAEQKCIGSLAGEFNGIVKNCTSAATVYGTDHIGGLVAGKGQSMGLCDIYDSNFTGKVEATGKFVGGILGAGYIAGSAPNTPCAVLINNYNTGTIIGADNVGGIFGGEGYDRQCWGNGKGYIQANYSSGIVKATNGENVGGIVGYMYALDCNNIVSDNYYVQGTADKGIGKIENVDKTLIFGRNDDPTGEDADKLSKVVSQEDVTNGNLVKLLNKAENSSRNWIQSDNVIKQKQDKHLLYLTTKMLNDVPSRGKSVAGGAEFPINDVTVTATYSDGETVTLDNKDVQFVGFDSSKKGNCMVAAKYEGKASYLFLQITSDAPESQAKITFDADNGTENIIKRVEKEQALDYIPEVPTKDGYIFVGWYKDTDDTTTEYKVGATYTENTTYKAKYAHLSMLGAQAKSVVNAKSGIRFGTKIYNDGDEIVEKGTLILPTNLLKEGEALTLENTKAAKSIAKVNYEINKDENYVVYLGTLVGIPESQFDIQITATAYVIYKDKSGNEYTVYAPYQKGSISINQLKGFQ